MILKIQKCCIYTLDQCNNSRMKDTCNFLWYCNFACIQLYGIAITPTALIYFNISWTDRPARFCHFQGVDWLLVDYLDCLQKIMIFPLQLYIHVPLLLARQLQPWIEYLSSSGNNFIYDLLKFWCDTAFQKITKFRTYMHSLGLSWLWDCTHCPVKLD